MYWNLSWPQLVLLQYSRWWISTVCCNALMQSMCNKCSQCTDRVSTAVLQDNCPKNRNFPHKLNISTNFHLGFTEHYCHKELNYFLLLLFCRPQTSVWFHPNVTAIQIITMVTSVLSVIHPNQHQSGPSISHVSYSLNTLKFGKILKISWDRLSRKAN